MTLKNKTLIIVGVVVAVVALALTATQPSEQAAAHCASGVAITYDTGLTQCK